MDPPTAPRPARSAEVELSIHRSRVRQRVLMTLSSWSEATPRALAFACGINTQRLAWIMHGHWPAYRVELALIRLGLAEEIHTPNGRVYAITARGRKKARQLSARFTRSAKRRLDREGAL